MRTHIKCMNTYSDINTASERTLRGIMDVSKPANEVGWNTTVEIDNTKGMTFELALPASPPHCPFSIHHL